MADAAGRTVIVAGSMGPTGEIMAPMGTLTHERAVEMFHEQAEGLKAGGADVLWVETICAAEEYRAAAEAAALADMPWCGTMSFDTAGRTMMGLTSADDGRRWSRSWRTSRWPSAPIAASARRTCCAPSWASSRQGTERPIIAKGNAGIPKYVDGHIHYDGTPELMADYAVLARDCGATIIGGCCGTMPEHLAKMREALETRPRGPRPTLDQITAGPGRLFVGGRRHRRRCSGPPGTRTPPPARLAPFRFYEVRNSIRPRNALEQRQLVAGRGGTRNRSVRKGWQFRAPVPAACTATLKRRAISSA